MMILRPAYNTHIKQWGAYLESLEVNSVIKSVENHGRSYMEIIDSIYSAMRRSFAAVCPKIHYSQLWNVQGKTRSLCGRIDILTNSAKNTKDIQTVYTIQVPPRFNINFSLVDFSEDFNHPSYTGCGFNDILVSSELERCATFCGKPFPQTVIVRDSTAHIQSYHQRHDNQRPTLHITVYFEVIPTQKGIRSQENHLVFSQITGFYPTGVINYVIGNYSDSGHNLKVYKLCTGCTYFSRNTELLVRQHYPRLTTKMLHGFSILGHLRETNYLPLSPSIMNRETIRTFDSTDKLSMHEQIHQSQQTKIFTVETILKHELNMYNLLLTRPRNLLRPLYGRLIHSSKTGPSLVEVRVWTIHGPQFVKGQLQFEQLFVEIQRDKCPRGDTVVVYDGPPAGMLTAYGLISPFAVLYEGSCTDVVDVIKSSLGDITIFWIRHYTEECNVSFAYNQQPVLCSQISCTYTNLSVTGLEETVTFKEAARPSFQIFRFEASNEGNVQLRFHIHTADFLYSIEGCLYSALWLFEDSLRSVFCTQTNMMLLNSSTVQTKGLQFNRLAILIVKSYPQTVHIKFNLSFLATNCLGMLNPYINHFDARRVPQDRCFPNVHTSTKRQRSGVMYISDRQVRDCCFVLTYLENSLPTPLFYQFGIAFTLDLSVFHVDHTEFTAPLKKSCCYNVILKASLYMEGKVRYFANGCFHDVPKIKNQAFTTSSFEVFVHRNLNMDSCSSIFAIKVDQLDLCFNKRTSERESRQLGPFNVIFKLWYPCINTGLWSHREGSHTSFMNFFKKVDIQLEYYFKLYGTLEVRKSYAGKWKWVLILDGLRDEFYQFIDSRKTRRNVTITYVEVAVKSSFTVEFRMRKTHPINSDTFHSTPLMDSSPCPESSYSLLTRCYKKVATGSLSWLEAFRACERQGLNMLSLNSEQEWLALAHYLFENKYEVATVFLGLQRATVGPGFHLGVEYCEINIGILVTLI